MTTAMHQVLVVEDEPGIRTVVRVMLQSAGYRVIEADTATRAEIEARTHRPDLLIVDLGLPDGDGLEVIRRVRTWSPVPIIVLSARIMEEQKVAALDAGADDFVSKPFGSPELLARVRAALRRSVRSGTVLAAAHDRPCAHRPYAPQRAGRWPRPAPDAARVSCARESGAEPRHDRDAAPAAARGVGTGPSRRHPNPAGVHPQPAGEARAGPVTPEAHCHGSRARLPPSPRRAAGRAT